MNNTQLLIDIRVFQIDGVVESEITDSDIFCVIADRKGRVGVIEYGCYEAHVYWIDEPGDKRYRIERAAAQSQEKGS